MLAIVTLGYGLASGYFSASFIKLENQKHDLEQEIKDFDVKKSELQIKNAELVAQNKTLDEKVNSVRDNLVRSRAAATTLVTVLRTGIENRCYSHNDPVVGAANDLIANLNQLLVSIK
jgi:cytochrome oxidase Cu insertion factor (SCO1/SenC/PrrC family)